MSNRNTRKVGVHPSCAEYQYTTRAWGSLLRLLLQGALT
jgi:hypothetical protein